MAKLTSGQVANRLNISPYTLKRWYKFWESADVNELNELVKNGMPSLPAYEVFGASDIYKGNRVWDEEDIEALEAFQKWIPNTKNGIFTKYINKEEK